MQESNFKSTRKGSSGISRRDFLKGAAAGAVGVAATGLFSPAGAGIAQNQVPLTKETDKDASWYGTEPEIADSDISEEINVDVVVIGAGVAGVSAARSAAEAGASVVLFEKADSPQGRGEDYAVINGELQKRYERDNMDEDEIVDRLMKDFTYRVKRPILRRWASECAEAFDWFIAAKEDLYICDTTLSDVPDEHADLFLIPHRYPLPEHYDISREYFPIYPVTMQFLPAQAPMLTFHLQKGLDTGNLEARFGVFAQKLLREKDGRVTGTIVKNQDGTYIKANAKGVILATGDYGSNPDIINHFCPEVIENEIFEFWFNMDVEGNPTNTGDGLKMGAWIGAHIEQYHAPMIHHMGEVMGVAPFLLLDKRGKRFTNEDCPGQQLENQIEMLPDYVCYQIFDNSWKEQLSYMPASHGVACYYDETVPENNSFNRNYVSEQKLQDSVDSENTLMADTIEELLDKLDIDKDAALDSIARYNEFAHSGKDEDFNKASYRLFPVENGPFYACVFEKAAMLVCVGGLESDEECHVFDKDRNVIPGLYVAGNMQGNRYAVEYPTTVPGISHSMALTFGKIAGENAVNGV